MLYGWLRLALIAMLLDDILTLASDSADLLLRRDMYADGDQGHLVRDVLALANADAGDIRHLVFGAERVGKGIRVCGLDRAAIQRFRRFGYDLPVLIEPKLRVAPIFAELDGKPVAALEISDCKNPPYTLRRQITEDMRTGACWVRDGDSIRPARREDLDRMYGRHSAKPSVRVEVGFNGDPTCQEVRLDVPDTSQPPSQRAREQMLSIISAKKAANEMLGVDDTGIARLAHIRIFGPDAPFVQQGMDTIVQQYNHATDEYEDADRYYYFEQQAIRLDLAVRILQDASMQGVVIDLSLPRVPGFTVAERLYPDPQGRRTGIESRLVGYPLVTHLRKHAAVQVSLGTLWPGQVISIFETPLRIRVGPEMRGMKVALNYRVSARDLPEPEQGRLKLIFRR